MAASCLGPLPVPLLAVSWRSGSQRVAVVCMEGVLEQLEVLTNALLDEREQRERLTVSELCGRLAVLCAEGWQ